MGIQAFSGHLFYFIFAIKNKMLTDTISSADTQSLILKMLPVPLSKVPFHNNTPEIIRYFANGFPAHIAVHEVSAVNSTPKEYTQLHLHNDCDEINIILSQTSLVYKIQLNHTEYIVKNNSGIYIPRHTWHKANVLKGEGYFITMKM